MSNAEYQRRYRAASPEHVERTQALARARGRALRKLAQRHGAEYEKLVRAECKADGIPAPWEAPPKRYRARGSVVR